MAQFIKKAASISAITLVSRILGMIRDAMIAFVFGAGVVSDAFFIAFRPFDLIRKMMSDGILSISFIPVFSAYLAKDKKDQAVSMFFSALFFISVLSVLAIAFGIYFAPAVISILAPGYVGDSYSHTLACLLFKIMLPYSFTILLVALSMGVLNAHGNFHIPAATPILLNLSIISSAFLLYDWMSGHIAVLAIGVTFGGIVQLSLQIPFIARLGMFDFKQFVWLHPAVVKVVVTLLPSMVGAAAFQINILVAGLTATRLLPGSVSYLNYAERLVQFPLAMFATSVATVLLPMLSGRAAVLNDDDCSHDIQKKRGQGKGNYIETGTIGKSFETGIRLVFFLILPAMAGIMALSEPIVSLIFGRGAFDAAAVTQTGQCLFYLAAGLWAVAGIRVFVTFYYSLSNIRLPFFAGLISIVCNLLLSGFMAKTMGVNGLALSVSLSAMAGFVFLVCFVPNGVSLGKVFVSACRAVFISVIMFVLVRWMWTFWASGTIMVQAIGLVVTIAAGAAIYFLGARLLSNPEMAILTKLFFKEKIDNT
ncbi:MAG: murein biosynthesis integral membrane protein MurJ [Desulfobacterales bacterium]|nr:murein biosynthesis integral membrane protein MurJ [Desulfobacterales bacterium]